MHDDITPQQFEKMVSEAFERLPEQFRALVRNVALLVEDVVPEETRRELHLSSDRELLGLYHGVPRTHRHNDAPFALPDTITLYRIPIEEHAQETGKTLPDVIYETLWHEIGHHFGLEEDEVRKREEERFGS